MNTPELIAACRRRDPKAQRTLYENYLPYVYTIVRRFGVPERDQADLVQEIFVAVFSGLQRFDPQKGDFKDWLQSISVHKASNVMRRNRRSKVIPLQKITARGSSALNGLENLKAEDLINLIADLPEGYRDVFNLYVIDGYSHREIAKKLKIRASSSRSQLARAKDLLRQRLKQLQQDQAYGEL